MPQASSAPRPTASTAGIHIGRRMVRLDRGVSDPLVIQLPDVEFSHRRVIVIWPLANDPVHEFEPL